MKRISLLALLLISGILVVSCSEDPGSTNAVIAPEGPGPQLTVNLDDLEYEDISGTLMPYQGGVMSQNLTKWGPGTKNCRFSLVVPASSMPGSTPINFTMSIPTRKSYTDYADDLHQLLVIRLAPDGEPFSGPITIEGTWMPWQGAPPDPLYYWNGTEVGIATVTYIANINRYRVLFEVDHFSDWEVGVTEEPKK